MFNHVYKLSDLAEERDEDGNSIGKFSYEDFQKGNFVFVDNGYEDAPVEVGGFKVKPLSWPRYFIMAFQEKLAYEKARFNGMSDEDFVDEVSDREMDLEGFTVFQVLDEDVTPAQLAFVATCLEQKPFMIECLVYKGQIIHAYDGPIYDKEHKLKGYLQPNVYYDENREVVAQAFDM